jgi:hypothetical protein
MSVAKPMHTVPEFVARSPRACTSSSSLQSDCGGDLAETEPAHIGERVVMG